MELTENLFAEVTEFQEALYGFDVEAEQLDAGRANIALQQLRLGDVLVRRTVADTNLLLNTTPEKQRTSLLLSIDPGDEDRWCRIPMRKNRLFVVRPGREHSFFGKGSWREFEVSLPDRTILERGLLTEDELDEAMSPDKGHFQVRNDAATHFRRAFEDLFSLSLTFANIGANAGTTSALEELVISALDHLLASRFTEHSGSRKVRGTSHFEIVEKALVMIDPEFDPSTSAASLSGSLNVGERTLQRAFKSAFNVSPYQFILRRRLNAARRRLIQRPDISVTDIAFELGFSSSSEFARRYMQFYRERPSDTKRRDR